MPGIRPAVAPKKRKYKVLSTLKHDHKTYRKDSEVRLTDIEAARLIKMKTVEPIKTFDPVKPVEEAK